MSLGEARSTLWRPCIVKYMAIGTVTCNLGTGPYSSSYSNNMPDVVTGQLIRLFGYDWSTTGLSADCWLEVNINTIQPGGGDMIARFGMDSAKGSSEIKKFFPPLLVVEGGPGAVFQVQFKLWSNTSGANATTVQHRIYYEVV